MTNLSWAMIIIVIFVVFSDILVKIHERLTRKRKLAEDALALRLKIDAAKLKYSPHNRNAFLSVIRTPEEYQAAKELVDLIDGLFKEAGLERLKEYEEKLALMKFFKENSHSDQADSFN